MKLSRKGLALCLLLVLGSLVLAACGSSSDSSLSSSSTASSGGGEESSSGESSGGGEEITAKLAVIDDVSGSLAFVGAEQKNAAEIAIEDVNNSGMGVHLEADYMDSQSKPASAVSQAQSAVSDSGINGVVGFNLTETGNAVEPIFGPSGLPTLFLQVTEMPGREPNIFSMGPPTKDAAELAVEQVMKEDKPKKASIVWVEQPTLTEAAEVFKSKLEEGGADVPSYEGASLEATSFESQVAKAVGAGPDVVGISGTGPQDGAMLSELRSRGFKGTIFAQQAADAPSAREAAGKAYDGLIVGTYWNEAGANAAAKEFVAAYEKKFPSEPAPDVYGIQAWDAVHIYAEAVQKAGSTDNDAVVEQLTEDEFKGATQSTIKFGSDGFAELEGYVVRMTPEGAEVLVAPKG
jgi:branched-chain amino acid transport system substrate-binding protein